MTVRRCVVCRVFRHPMFVRFIKASTVWSDGSRPIFRSKSKFILPSPNQMTITGIGILSNGGGNLGLTEIEVELLMNKSTDPHG